MKQYLDKEQTYALIELGVDISDGMITFPHCGNTTGEEDVYEQIPPALTIGQLIERLPRWIEISAYFKPSLVICKTHIFYSQYKQYYFDNKTELIDNLYDCYIQLIKDGVIKV